MAKKPTPGRRTRARRFACVSNDSAAESRPPFGNKQDWLIFGFEGPDAAGFLTLTINDLKVASCGRDGVMRWLISQRQIEQLSKTPGVIDALKFLNIKVTQAEFEALAGVKFG